MTTQIKQMTYKVIAHNNPFAQKTISKKVSNNNLAFEQFEKQVKESFKDDKCNVEFNHAGKVVVLTYNS